MNFAFDAYHIYILAIVAIALLFDFINGFHDAANSIATVVSTRVLSPRVAVLWAAFFNIIAAVGMGTAVAATIGKGIVNVGVLNPNLILAALIGAIAWNIITWYFGLPSSSSHALIGGLAGAGLVEAGVGGLILWQTTPSPLVYKGIFGIAIYIVVAPLLAFALGFLFRTAVGWIFRGNRPSKVDGMFRRFQLVSSAVYSYSHGSNDAQKTMGIIYALLIAAGLGSWAHANDIDELRGRLVAPESTTGAWVLRAEGNIPVPDRKHVPDGTLVALEQTDDLARLARTGGEVTLYGNFEKLKSGEEGFKQKQKLSWWVILAAHFAIGLGTYFGGWRIVKTMGSKITKLHPSSAFCAEAGGGATILAMSAVGMPVSTTHTITGAIIGVGTTRRLSAVRWGVARTVVWAWVLTIPAAALVAGLAYLPFKLAGM